MLRVVKLISGRVQKARKGRLDNKELLLRKLGQRIEPGRPIKFLMFGMGMRKRKR